MFDFADIKDINDILNEYERTIKSDLSIDTSLLAEQIHDLTKNKLTIRKKVASNSLIMLMINRLHFLWIITVMTHKYIDNDNSSDKLDSLFYNLYLSLKKAY